VKYKGVSKPVTLYLWPYLEQTAYFGVDFWRAFGLAPTVVETPVAREASKLLKKSMPIIRQGQGVPYL